MSESKPRVTTFVLQSGYSQRRGETSCRIQLQPRGKKTKCGRCGRGVVLTWPMGSEPIVRNCAVCGAKTDIHFMGGYHV